VAGSSTVTRIPQLDVQFAAGSAYDPVKLQRMVQSLTSVIGQVNNQNAQIAAIAAEETTGVAKHVLATEEGLGPAHTVSGLIPGNVLVATSDTTAEFAALEFSQLAQVDPNTFAAPAQGDVITFINGFWSAVPSNPLNLTNPGRDALVMWVATDEGANGNYAFAVPDTSLILTPGGLSVNQGAIVHANLAGLQFVNGSTTVIANDHPQYAMLAAANTWPAQQTFAAGIISQSDIDVTGNIEQMLAEPEWRIQNTDDAVDEGTWRMHAEPGQLIFSTVSDDGSDGENWLSVTRAGELADAVNVQSNSFTFNGDSIWTDAHVAPGANVYFTVDSFGRRVINSGAAAVTTQYILAAGWNSASGAIPVASTVAQDLQIPYGSTLQEVRIQTQGGSGSCTVTLSTSTFPFVTGTDITGGVPPAIASSTSYDNTALSGWTTVFAQGAMIRATLTANSTFTSVKIFLRFK
jgi:hypothetical protein